MAQIDALTFDAIVVGSGMTGGWAAKELTELGLRTLVLDAGRPLVPAEDYAEHKRVWDMPFRGLGDRRYIEERQATQRQSVSFDEWSHRFWVDDKDNPYTTPQDKPFDWFRARQVGGKSTIWGRQVYRWSDLDFEANAVRASASIGPFGMPSWRLGTTAWSLSSASAGGAKGWRTCPTGPSCRRCRSTASSSTSRIGFAPDSRESG